MGSKLERPGMPLRQRGAVAIWVAVSLVALFTATFLAIDVGRLYYTQRDLQRLASLAATAGTQVASGCAGQGATGKPGSLSAVTTLVQNAMQSNGGSASLTYLTGVNGYPPVELGTFVTVNNLRTFKPLPEGDDRIDAVRVNVSRPQPTPFIGFLTGGGTMKASASAQQPLNGSLSVGSTLLGLKGGLLNNVIGSLVCARGDLACQANVISLSVASYATGLADTSVSLGQLATAANVSVQDLSDPLTLSTQTIVLSDFLNNLAGGLSGNASATVTGLLTNLAAAAVGNRQEIPLGQVLGSVDDVAGAVPFVNLLDLIAGLGQAAQADPNGNSITPIVLPVSINVPNVAAVTAYLQILSPMEQSGSGRPGVTEAHTAQVKLKVRVSVLNALLSAVQSTLNSILSLLKLAGITATLDKLNLNIGADVEVSPSTAYLDGIECPTFGVNNGLPTAHLSASSSIVGMEVGTFVGTATATSAPDLDTSTAGATLIKISLSGILGPGTLTVPMAVTEAGVGAGVARTDLTDITEFEPGTTPEKGKPLIYNALGGPGVTPVVAVQDNPQTVSSPVDVDLSVGIHSEATGSGAAGLVTKLIGGLLNGVIDLVQTQLIVPVINLLADTVINPVLESLGVQSGSATVTMNSVQIARPLKVATCMPGSAGSNACLIAP